MLQELQARSTSLGWIFTEPAFTDDKNGTPRIGTHSQQVNEELL